MAEKIVSLLKNRKTLKEMGKNALKVADTYTKDEVIKKWVELFNEKTK